MIQILLPMLLAAGLSQAVAPSTLSPTRADSLLRAETGKPAFHLLDVRTPEEFAQGHLKGAKLVDVKSPQFDSIIAILPRQERYFVYCRSGHRSGMAVERMTAMGFQNVRHLAGGIGAWSAAGLPVEH